MIPFEHSMNHVFWGSLMAEAIGSDIIRIELKDESPYFSRSTHEISNHCRNPVIEVICPKNRYKRLTGK